MADGSAESGTNAGTNAGTNGTESDLVKIQASSCVQHWTSTLTLSSDEPMTDYSEEAPTWIARDSEMTIKLVTLERDEQTPQGLAAKTRNARIVMLFTVLSTAFKFRPLLKSLTDAVTWSKDFAIIVKIQDRANFGRLVQILTGANFQRTLKQFVVTQLPPFFGIPQTPYTYVVRQQLSEQDSSEKILNVLIPTPEILQFNSYAADDIAFLHESN